MKMTRTLTIGLSGLYLLSMVLAFVPVGAAQATPADRPVVITADQSKGAAVDFPGSKSRLSPEIEQAEITYNFLLTFPGPSECIGTTILVDFKLLSPPTTAIVTPVSGQTTVAYEGNAAPGTPVPGTINQPPPKPVAFKINVAFKREAPAFVDQVFNVEAQAFGAPSGGSGCTVTHSTSKAQQAAQIKPDYLPSIQVLPDAIIQSSGQNKKVLFPVKIINFGNGPTRVATTVIEKTKGLNSVNPPSELFLESKATNGEKAQNNQQVFITVLTPNKNGYTNKVYSFEATFKARSDTTSSDLSTQEVTIPLSTKVQGVYVPGFDAPLMILGVGLGVALLGLNRRRD